MKSSGIPKPIFSGHNTRTDPPLSKKYASEFAFLKHDSVIKLNDIRTVSDARIKYSHHVSISPDSATYQFIEENVFRRYFPSVSYTYDKLKAEHQTLVQQYEEANTQIEELKQQLEENRK